MAKMSPVPNAPWLMLAALTAVFALSQAFRTVATIIAGPLQSEFHLSDDALGVFSGAFHLAFAALQLVMGVALDIYGARRTVGVVFLAAVVGAVASAFASDFSVLIAGQLLIGLGCAPAFLATVVFIANRYPAEQFARSAGLVLGFGGLGMLLTGTPLAWVVQSWSWRVGLLVLAAGAALAWLATVVLVSDGPRARRERETFADGFRQLRAILAEKHTLGIIVLGAVTYAAFITLRGLWVVPLLVERHEHTLVQSGHVVLAASIATLFGPAIFGRLDPGGRARRFWIIAFTMAFAALFGLLAYGAPAAIDVGLAILSGIVAGYIILQHADVRAAYSPGIVGRALATFNMAVFAGVALMQWISGIAASLAADRGIDPFATVFVVIAVLLSAGTLAFVVLPWPPGLPRVPVPASRSSA
jgi:predicted MFS family arabinose efflux permease